MWREALALDLDPFGVRVVLVEPGATESGFAKPDPASVVTDAVLRALTDPDPPLWIPTGRGTRAQILAVQLLLWSIYRAVARWKLRFKAR